MSVSVFEDVKTQLSLIERFKPDVLDGFASSLLLLAKEVKSRGLNTIKPRFLISGADLIDLGSRKFVEEVFNAPFFDQYGAAEFERLAWQCEEKCGYHIDVDSVIMEFVDEKGFDVASGETGEIVCTSLFNRAMPFIRYALGDVGKASEESVCSCGRSFPLMKVIEGRKNEMIVLPYGRAVSSLAFIVAMYQLSFYSSIDKFRVVQKSVDHFRFFIKMKENVNLDHEAVENEIREHFSKVFNLSSDCKVNFEVEFVEDFALDKSGKFRIVTSEIYNSGE